MKNTYTIQLAWENKERRESNLSWMLLHFRFPPTTTVRGRTAKLSTIKAAKFRVIKRLASQCGAEVLQIVEKRRK